MAPRQTGKTTLVNRLLRETDRKICGFSTRKIDELATEEGYCPVYISPVGEEPVIDDDYCLGLCGKGRHYTNPKAFDEAGVEFLTCSDPDTLIIMDEVGFLELEAEKFKARIFECLASENPVLLMLKERMDIDFLRRIRDFEGVEFIQMTEQNREEVYKHVKEAYISSLCL